MAVILGATIGMGIFLMVKAEEGYDFMQGLVLSIAAILMLTLFG